MSRDLDPLALLDVEHVDPLEERPEGDIFIDLGEALRLECPGLRAVLRGEAKGYFEAYITDDGKLELLKQLPEQAW